MGFAAGYEAGYNVTSKAIEATFKAFEERRWKEESNKALAAAEAKQQEIDAQFTKQRIERAQDIQAKLEAGEISEVEAFHKSIETGYVLDAERDVATNQNWGRLISQNAANPILVNAAQARWQQDFDRAKQRDQRRGEAIRSRAQIMQQEIADRGATARQLSSQGVNPFAEGSKEWERFESNEDFKKDAQAIDLALRFHGGKGGQGGGVAQLIAAANADAAGESLTSILPQETTIEQLMDTASVMRGMLDEGPDGFKRAWDVAKKENAKRQKAQAKAEAAETEGGKAPAGKQTPAQIREANKAGGGPSAQPQPGEAAMKQMDWWKSYFTGEAAVENGG